MTTNATPHTTSTMAAQIAASAAKNAVPSMLTAIKVSKAAAMVVLALALLVTYPHMGTYLASLPYVGWAGWVIAAIFDLGILTMAQLLQTAALAAEAKQRAGWTLVILTVGSAGIQAAAPGPTGVKVLFASVILITLLIKWVVAAVKPDFEALAAFEQAATATATATAPTAPVFVPEPTVEVQEPVEVDVEVEVEQAAETDAPVYGRCTRRRGCTCGRHRMDRQCAADCTCKKHFKKSRKATEAPAGEAEQLTEEDAAAMVRTLQEIKAIDTTDQADD